MQPWLLQFKAKTNKNKNIKVKTRENKRTVKLDFFFKTTIFGHVLKNQHIHFWVHGHSSLVHIWFTPSEGPKGFVNWFFKKPDHGSWTWCRTMKKDHLPWSNFMVHGVNWPLFQIPPHFGCVHLKNRSLQKQNFYWQLAINLKIWKEGQCVVGSLILGRQIWHQQSGRSGS